MVQENTIDSSPILESLGVDGCNKAERIRGGTDTVLWRVETGEGTYALRLFRSDQMATYTRELAAMRAARQAGIPVPRVQAHGVRESRPAMLLSWASGQRVETELIQRPWRAWRLGIMLGRMQAAIHRVPAPSELCQVPEAWIDWAGPEETTLKSRLRELASGATALLHLDFHDLNVMTDGNRITGVLDWANALAGDPRACYARTQLMERVIPAALKWSLRTRLCTWFLSRAWRRGYQQAAGPLQDMAVFYAWAGVVTARDLAKKPKDQGLEPFINDIWEWTSIWKHRAGLKT